MILALGFATWADGSGFAPAVARQLGETLKTHPAVGRLLVVNPFRSLGGHLLRRRFAGLGRDFRDSPGSEIYQPLRLRRGTATTAGAVERTYEAYGRRICARAQRSGMLRPRLITTDPLTAAFAPIEWTSGVTYYAIDDWVSHHALQPWQRIFRLAYQRIRERRVKVCAVSQPIIDRIEPAGPWVVSPNGISPSVWANLPAEPRWLERLPRPRLVYVGTLDSRIDLGLLSDLVSRFQSGSLVLVGPDATGHLGGLGKTENVYVHPEVDGNDVPPIVGACDVGIIPHADTPLTRAMSPMKLFEYLAAGLPVAATDLPGVRGVSDRVVTSGPGVGFGDAVARALELGRWQEDNRRDFINRNSWSSRHATILSLALDTPGSPIKGGS